MATERRLDAAVSPSGPRVAPLGAAVVTVETSDEPPREGWRPRQRKESLVLTLTDSARTAVHTLTTKAGLPDETGGLRIAQQEAGGFELALVPEPLPGDDVVTDGSTRVYVDPEASRDAGRPAPRRGAGRRPARRSRSSPQ